MHFRNMDRVCVIKGDKGKQAAYDVPADKTWEMLL